MCSSISALALSPLVIYSVLICLSFHSRSFPLLYCFLSFPHHSTEESGSLPRAAEESGESQGESLHVGLSLCSSICAVFVELRPLSWDNTHLSLLFHPSLPYFFHLSLSSHSLFSHPPLLPSRLRTIWRGRSGVVLSAQSWSGCTYWRVSHRAPSLITTELHHRTTPSHTTSRRGYIEPTIPRLFVLLYIHKYV